ncbi:MAG TPA: pilus assembly protein TadG-related protein [Gemmataceae bacterium]|jgi:Flp pilus assembly protein TadG
MRARETRTGTIIPLLALVLVALLSMVALGVDLGVLALARSQCQHAADAAALATVRTLNGTPGNNAAAAVNNGQTIASQETVMGRAVNPSTELTLTLGSYVYDYAANRFRYELPRQTQTENLTLVQAVVSRRQAPSFAKVFGATPVTVAATATAAHRPRDITLILDFSGSMNNESDLWNNESYLGTENNSPNNLDTRVPRFGAYSYSPGAGKQLLITTSTSPVVGKCNVTQPALGTTAMVDNYFADETASPPTPAFTSAGVGDATGFVAGDVSLRTTGQITGTNPFAQSVSDITGSVTTVSSNWETQGYDYYYTLRGRKDVSGNPLPFNGYTTGPAYYGKTFFIWPPDPRAPVGQPDDVSPHGRPAAGKYTPGDWRRRFFFKSEDSAPAAAFADGVNDNGRLWNLAQVNSGGQGSNKSDWRDPVNGSPPSGFTAGYRINYKAILKWIKYDGPNPFPNRLEAGRILYYDQIPDDVPAAAYDPTYASRKITDPNQRFWREYIDYVIGVWKSPYGAVQRPGNPACSIGPDFTWASGGTFTTAKVAAKPSDRYMAYDDRPVFPRHRFWFGPMTLVQYLSDTGNIPGTATDISLYSLKLGVQLGLQDIQLNYPNSQVALIPFNRPRYSGEPQDAGRFTTALVPMTGDYTSLINALWYAPGTAHGATVRPWDQITVSSTRAYGDYTGNTASYFGFMVAHNELSSSPTARTFGVGGHGRRGTDRIVIFETDGMANVAGPSATMFQSAETFYDIRSSIDANGNSVTNATTDGSSAKSRVLEVVNRIVAQETDTVNGPGFARPNQAVTVHTLAFGAVFESNAAEKPTAVDLLQSISAVGGTVFPDSDSDPDNGFKWIIGDLDARKEKMRQAVLKCMRTGVRVALMPNTLP